MSNKPDVLNLIGHKDVRAFGNHWTILDSLGSGGAGYVYLAEAEEDCSFVKRGERVAIKIYKEWLFENKAERQVRRIEREVKLLDKKHKNLCSIFAHGEILVSGTERHCLAMEYIDGPLLSKYIEKTGPADLFSFKDIFLQVFEGVQFLHSLNVSHRDLKPDNIILQDNRLLKILDFGVIHFEDETTVRESHEFLGTIRYSAPEWVFVAHGEIDYYLGDYYSLGAIGHDLIVGEPIFKKYNNRHELAMAVREEIPQIASEKIPWQILTIVKDLLRKKPNGRLAHKPEEIYSLISKETGESQDDDYISEIKKTIEPHIEENNKRKREAKEKRRIYEKSKNISEKIGLDFIAVVQEIKRHIPTISTRGANVSAGDEFSFDTPFIIITPDLARGIHCPMTIFLAIKINIEEIIELHLEGQKYEFTNTPPQEIIKYHFGTSMDSLIYRDYYSSEQCKKCFGNCIAEIIKSMINSPVVSENKMLRGRDIKKRRSFFASQNKMIRNS